MKVFTDQTLSWAGKQYRIPAGRMLEAIARIEDHVTLVEITRHFQQRASIPLARLALAFHAVLEFAGAPPTLTAEHVYHGMFGDQEAQEASMTAVSALLQMMVPPDILKGGKASAPGNSRRDVAPSSRKRTKRS